jgi:hypothetical protein
MKRCNEYEVELSAMLDGESDPATAVMLMDHISQCESCRGFYLELRSFQSLVDDLSLESDAEVERRAAVVPIRSRQPRWRGWLDAPPRWAWGLAAAVVVIVGLWASNEYDLLNRQSSVIEDGQLIVRSGEGSDLNEERFVEIAAEILGADQRYQNEMYHLLRQVRSDESADESPLQGEGAEGGRGESYGEVFAAIGGRPVLD